MQEKTVKESSIISSHLMLMEHAGNFLFDKNNPIGLVHGGIIMTLTDEVAGMVASKHCRRPVVTALIDRMYFFAPIYIGNRLILKASINYVGKTSLEIGVRIEAEDLKTGKIKGRDRLLESFSVLFFLRVCVSNCIVFYFHFLA